MSAHKSIGHWFIGPSVSPSYTSGISKIWDFWTKFEQNKTVYYKCSQYRDILHTFHFHICFLLHFHTCIFLHLHTLTLEDSHTCMPSHSHTCILTHLNALSLAYSHARILQLLLFWCLLFYLCIQFLFLFLIPSTSRNSLPLPPISPLMPQS